MADQLIIVSSDTSIDYDIQGLIKVKDCPTPEAADIRLFALHQQYLLAKDLDTTSVDYWAGNFMRWLDKQDEITDVEFIPYVEVNISEKYYKVMEKGRKR